MALAARVRAWASPVVKPIVRRVRYRWADLADRRSPTVVSGVPIPPTSLQRLNGPQEFVKVGATIAESLVRNAGLTAGEDVLDVGCGSGRVALPLISILGPDGSYEGFDVVPEAVAWCQRRITAAHPNFRFQLADVHSDHYHRAGTQTAETYVFPFADATFDLVFLTSIFTHLGADATENYLRQCARVLRPDGRLFATFFLMDEFAAAAVAAGSADRAFHPAADGAFTTNPRDPDAAVAHDESTIRAILERSGMELRRPPLRGTWCGRPDGAGLQDVIVAHKA